MKYALWILNNFTHNQTSTSYSHEIYNTNDTTISRPSKLKYQRTHLKIISSIFHNAADFSNFQLFTPPTISGHESGVHRTYTPPPNRTGPCAGLIDDEMNHSDMTDSINQRRTSFNRRRNDEVIAFRII